MDVGAGKIIGERLELNQHLASHKTHISTYNDTSGIAVTIPEFAETAEFRRKVQMLLRARQMEQSGGFQDVWCNYIDNEYGEKNSNEEDTYRGHQPWTAHESNTCSG